MTTLDAWMRAGRHLPKPLKDFHNQKDLFKAMHDRQIPPAGAPHSPADDVSWIAGQCYVIDRFLWFMAKRGYTLQRSRAVGVPFQSLEDDIAQSRAARLALPLPGSPS